MCAAQEKKQERSFTPPTTPHTSVSLSLGGSSPMEKPSFEPEAQTPQVFSPSSSGRRTNDPNSPEFEFWMIRNPSFPQPHLLSADELIVDGVLLPLDLISHHSDPSNSDTKINPSETPNPEPESGPIPEHGPGPESSTASSTSKRWRDIFKIGDKKTSNNQEDKGRDRDRDKEKKRDRKISSGASTGAELNINIWPFLRSRSAGNSGNRPKMGSGAATRKVSSAPCSRSNSSGESKLRKWPNSPGRGGGIHLGRSSPVWQVRRGGSGVKRSEPVVRNGKTGGGGGRGRVLNLNVPMCIGYRQPSSCRSDDNILVGGRAGGDRRSSSGGAGDSGQTSVGVKLFNLRTLFSKKVY